MKIDQAIIAVIPAHNEETSIRDVVSKAREYTDQVITVDDCSTDNTCKHAKEAGAIVLKHVVNRGVGASTSTGIQAALKLGADIIVTLDADGQHLPKDIPNIIKPILENDADIVIGSRFKGDTQEMPLTKKIGNVLLNKITYLLYKINMTDTQSGFKAFNRDAANLIDITIDRYGFCSEVIGEIKKKKLRCVEIPIPTIYINKNKGTTMYDGFKIISDLILRGIK